MKFRLKDFGIKYRIFFILLLYFSISVAATKPLIYIVATGGTIAGKGTLQTSNTYKAGVLTASELISSIPSVAKYADIKYKQLFNKDSGDITISDWLFLNKEVNQLLNDPKVNGIVITHGTDTLEETAYFLNLTIKSRKPVVIVGSMRAATALSSDGPLNLYNAIAVAADANSVGRGVMVAMNEDIWGARDVTKSNTTSIQTFTSYNSGKLGTVFMGKVKFYNNGSNRKHTADTPFNVVANQNLPEVAIIYEYVGINQDMLLGVLNIPNLKGIILAGLGDGNIPDYEDKFIKQAIAKNIIVVRASRVSGGDNTYNYNNLDTNYGTISADNLNPQKARVLLMLALTKMDNKKIISQYFNTY